MRKCLSVILVLAMLLSVMMIGSAAAEEVKITGAGCSPSTVSVGENVLFFVWTSLETRYIALFDEGGNQLCDWPADAHSMKDGQSRVWNVIVPTDTVGVNNVLLKASADGMNYTKEYKVSFTVTEDAPERIGSGLPETTNVVRFLSRSIGPYEKFFVDVYTSDNAKVLALVDANGEVLQSWKAEESARHPKAGQCIWTVMLRPSASGELRYTFCASEDGVTYGNTMSTTVTVNDLDSSVYSAYLGTWYGVRITEGGETYDLSELGMAMKLAIHADGSVRMDLSGDVNEAVWQTDNGCIIIEGAPLTLDGDTLTMRDYGSEMVFSREPAGGEAVDLSGYPEYLGDWFCTSMTEGGERLNPAEYGMEIILTLNADGSAVLDMAGDAETAAWNVNEGGITLMTLQGTLQADGTLAIAEDGTEMIFSRESAAKAAPTQEPTYDIGRIDVYKVGYHFSGYMGTWYGVRITEDGQTYDLAELGLDMTLTLDDDCHVTLDMAGDVEETTWENGGDCIIVAGAPLTLDGDTLTMREDGTEIVFSREAPAEGSTDEPTTGMPDPSAYPEYLGDWYCISMTEGGETASPADYGMEITLTLNADAFGTLDMAGDVENVGWSVIGDGISVMGLKGTLQADGTLVIKDESTEMVFSREKPEGQQTDGGVDMSAYADYIGAWFSDTDEMTVTIREDGTATVEINGDVTSGSLTEDYGYLYFGDAMLRMQYDGKLLWSAPDADVFLTCAGEESVETNSEAFDMTPYMDFIGLWGNGEITLTLTEDGKAELTQNGETRALTVGEAYGYLKVDDLFLILQSDGTLSVSGDIYAVLYRDGIVPTSKPMPTSTPTPEPTSEPISIDERMDKRYVCVGADMEGYRLDASMLGGEYAMTFYADGRMELVLAGMEIPGGCAWETATVTDENGTEQTAFIIDYFGMKLQAVLTDTGFEMNYMDSMLMYFELEEDNQ